MLGIFLQAVVGTDSLAQPLAQAATESAQKVDSLSLWSMVQKGGWIMIPIGILSIVTVYIFIERFIVLARAGRN